MTVVSFEEEKKVKCDEIYKGNTLIGAVWVAENYIKTMKYEAFEVFPGNLTVPSFQAFINVTHGKFGRQTKGPMGKAAP